MAGSFGAAAYLLQDVEQFGKVQYGLVVLMVHTEPQ